MEEPQMQWKLIKIDLSYDDAELFKLFQQHHEEFFIMLNAGLFDFKNGKGIIYRDQNGTIQSVDVMQKTFKRSKGLTAI